MPRTTMLAWTSPTHGTTLATLDDTRVRVTVYEVAHEDLEELAKALEEIIHILAARKQRLVTLPKI